MMSEKRFETKIDDVDSSIIVITDTNEDFAWFLSDIVTDKQVEKVVHLLNSLADENKELRQQVKRLQDIATRTEAEKEEYVDLYNECRKKLECCEYEHFLNELDEIHEKVDKGDLSDFSPLKEDKPLNNYNPLKEKSDVSKGMYKQMMGKGSLTNNNKDYEVW